MSPQTETGLSPLPQEATWRLAVPRMSGYRLLFCHGLGATRRNGVSRKIEAWASFKRIPCHCISYTDYGRPDRIWNVNDWRRDILSELHRTHRLGMDGTIVVSNSAACQAVLRAILDAQKTPVAHVAGLLMFSPGVWLTLDYMERAVAGSVEALKSGQVLQHPCADTSLKINVNLPCLMDFVENCVCRVSNRVPIECPVRIVHGRKDPLVPYQNSIKLFEQLTSKDKDLSLTDDGHFITNETTISESLESLWNAVQLVGQDKESVPHQRLASKI